MTLDTNDLFAYLGEIPEAVVIISNTHQLAIPIIVAGEFAFGIAQSRHNEWSIYALSGQHAMPVVTRILVSTSPAD